MCTKLLTRGAYQRNDGELSTKRSVYCAIGSLVGCAAAVVCTDAIASSAAFILAICSAGSTQRSQSSFLRTAFSPTSKTVECCTAYIMDRSFMSNV